MKVSTVCGTIGLALLTCGLGTARASAQAWSYPSMHHPVIMERQFNFAVASGGNAGTSLFAQWREGLSPTLELDFEGDSLIRRSGTRRDASSWERVSRCRSSPPSRICPSTFI